MKSCTNPPSPCSERLPRLKKAESTGNIWLVTSKNGDLYQGCLVHQGSQNTGNYPLGQYLGHLGAYMLQDYLGEVTLSN